MIVAMRQSWEPTKPQRVSRHAQPKTTADAAILKNWSASTKWGNFYGFNGFESCS